MSDIQKLAEILQILVAQDLGAATEGSAKYLVFTKAYEELQRIKE